MELNRKKFQYFIDGKEYLLKSPNVGIIKKYKKDLKACEKGDMDEVDAMIELLAQCGLPNEVSESLEMHHVEQIIGDISGEKKN